MRDDVTAVVLVGGRSRRMGRDKALLVPDEQDGRTLTRRVLDALRPVAAHALLAGRPIEGVDVPAIADHYQGTGPLAGIAAALQVATTPLAVVAACDMPWISTPLVEHLIDRARAAPQALAVMCTTERGLEPLLSVWRSEAAPNLHSALQAGVRAIHEAVATIPHVVVQPDEWRRIDPDDRSFVNWNRPEDVGPG